MNVERIPQPPSLKSIVVDRLQTLLIERAFQPGDHLVEGDLAERLGVSRGPVREALQELERDGWVEVRPRQGAFVHVPSDKEVADFFEVRAVLEGEAARLAAQRNASIAFQALQPIVDEAVSLQGPGAEQQHLAELTSRFHTAVTTLADNSLLERLVAQLNSRTRWYFRPLVDRIASRAWQEHIEIADAIIAGQADEAAKLMIQHVTWSHEEYRQLAERIAGDEEPAT